MPAKLTKVYNKFIILICLFCYKMVQWKILLSNVYITRISWNMKKNHSVVYAYGQKSKRTKIKLYSEKTLTVDYRQKKKII